MLGLNGIAALIVAVGDMLFIVIMVGAILFGKRFAEAAAKPAPEPVAAAAGRYGSAGTLAISRTYVLTMNFFGVFVLYYFVNWKYLSQVCCLS